MKKITALLIFCALTIGFLTFPAEAHDMGKIGTYQTVSMSGTHTAAIKTDGFLYVWGNNDYGQIGNGGGTDAVSGNGTPYQSSPVKVLDNVVSVSCGSYHTAAVRGDGSLWVWGNNDYGQVGNGGGGNASYKERPIQTTPVKVLDDVAAVSCGENCTAAVKTDGTLWICGSGYGSAPVKIMDGVAAVSGTNSLCSVIKKDGTLWAWGAMFKEGKPEYILTSTKYTDPVKIATDVAAVSCGSSSLAYIKNDGTVWTWGSNGYGQRGDGTVDDSYSYPIIGSQPTQVKGLSNAVSISCGNGFAYAAAVLADGSLWTWGSNYIGQLGNGLTGNEQLDKPGNSYHLIQTIPVKVMDQAASVFCGSYATAAIKSDGTFWTWGDNVWDMLGDQDYDRRLTISTSWGSATWGVKITPHQVGDFAVKPSGGNGAAAAPVAPASPTKFTDVSATSPFVDAINWAVEKNITTGKTDTTFAPGEECTNGQILTFLWRANGSLEPTVDNPFTDPIPASFQKAALWAYEKGLVSGAVFGASTPCTRAMTVEYLWKAAGSPATSGSASFTDVPANADYAQAVAWAVENGVTSGTGSGQFSPDNTCTRGQIVTFLYRSMA